MSLEEALKAHATALAANTAAMEKNTALLSGALAARGTGSTGMTAAEAENRRAPEAPGSKGDATEGKAAGKRGAKKTDAPKGPPTLEDLRELAGGFLSVSDKKEKDARKEFIGQINERLGVERVTETPEDQRQQVMEWIAARAKDSSFELPEADGESSDDASDSLI